QKLFPRGSALNQKVRFSGVNFSVVGVIESGGMGGENQDNRLLVPITYRLGLHNGLRDLTYYVQARDQARYDDTVEQVRGVLRALRKVSPEQSDDFEISSNDSMIQMFR